MEWYPQNKKELNELLEQVLNKKINNKNIKAILVPHACYKYSGAIAGKAYSFLKNQGNKTAIILSPSHYIPISGVVSHNKRSWKTPIGNIKILDSNFPKIDLSKEHAIDNQIPFLQKLGFLEILPLIVGEITIKEAKQIAEKIKDFSGIFIFSTDLSHFLSYEQAILKDAQTIEAITSLNSKKLTKNSACGFFPLLVLIELCKIKKLKPELIEYKNSGDITGNKESVVGYSSFIFSA